MSGPGPDLSIVGVPTPVQATEDSLTLLLRPAQVATENWGLQQASVRAAIRNSIDSWNSVAGVAWAGEVATAATTFDAPIQHLDTARTLLPGYIQQVADLRSRARAILADAQKLPAGTHSSAAVPGVPDSPHSGEYDELNRRASQVHAEFLAARTAIISKLDALTAELSVPAPAVPIDYTHTQIDPTISGVPAGPVTVPPLPAAGTSPAQVTAWWHGLTTDQQNALLQSQPGAIGNLDGIPADVRDYANRRNLPILINALQQQVAATGDPSAASQLASLRAVQAALGKPSPAPQLLLGLDLVGEQGRAIISTGNPDTATNIATFVTGTGTKLTGIGGDVARSNAMYKSAGNAGSSAPAVITWYGYDAPQSLLDATSQEYAKAAATALDSFQTGLRATHQGTPSVNTVIGHSYGTTVVGYAASHGNALDTDNVILVASPGITVDHASDLHLTGIAPDENSSHVYATAAAHDPVPLFAGLTLGPSTTDSDFGATPFAADPGPASPSAHSSYWTVNNQSLLNMGRVIAGHGDQTTEPPKQGGSVLLQPTALP